MTLGVRTKFLFLFLLPMIVSLAQADENKELGVVNKPGRTMTAKEAVTKSWTLVKKYEKAKTNLGDAFGLSGKQTAPALAATPVPKEVQPKPAASTDISSLEQTAPAAPAISAIKKVRPEPATCMIKLKNGRTLKNCSIQSQDKKGLWIVYEGNIRLYLANDEIKEVSTSKVVR